VTDLYALLPVVGIFAVFWLLLVLPARRRQRAMIELQSGIALGDTLVTSGGIYGTVARVDDDRVALEIAPGVVVEVARGAVVGTPVAPTATDTSTAPEAAPEAPAAPVAGGEN
jgi:preprotein translocase subunit YajC